MKFGKGRVPSTFSRATHTFASVPTATIPRSVFNRSHGHKTTFNEGYLVPIFVDEILPGDTYNLHLTAFGRLSTLLFPIMDNLFLDVHFFFVPNRLTWTNWERFNGAQDNPTDSTDFTIPVLDDSVAPMSTTGFTSGSLADYFGLPTLVAASAPGNFRVNALPFRAYSLIYNTWYRDENLQDSVPVPTDDGPDDPADYSLLRRGKRHDYFTSCLPWPQKINDGSTLNVPLQGTAPVTGIGLYTNVSGAGASGNLTESDGGVTTYPFVYNSNLANTWGISASSASAGAVPQIFADLSQATGITINELREAFQIQKMFERDARGGTRYTEIIHSHFGVVSPDARLQRPEYLGGCHSNSINVVPVPQTSNSGAVPSEFNTKGSLAAFGTVSVNNCGFVKSFTEHGYVIGIASIRADLNYQQGLRRMWTRETRYDFYWPSLSHLGEQTVLNQEIYFQGTGGTGSTNDGGTFGYQERYGEYRYFPGQISGLFRTNAAGTYDSWHLAQSFGSLPALDETFIVENAPMTRILAVSTEPHFLFDSYFNLKCARPMPVYAVPGLIDHF